MKMRLYKMALSKTFLGAETPKRRLKNLTRSKKLMIAQIALIWVFIVLIAVACLSDNMPAAIGSVVAIGGAIVLEGYRV